MVKNGQIAPKTAQDGFTLIEVMVVALIFGVLAGLAAPSFQQAYDRSNLRGGENLVISALKKARSYAVSNKVPFGLDIDQESRVVTLFQNTANPSDATFEDGDSVFAVDTLTDQFQYVNTSLEDGAFVFQPNGSVSSSGAIVMVAETESMLAYFSISVLASTGRVSSYSNFYNW